MIKLGIFLIKNAYVLPSGRCIELQFSIDRCRFRLVMDEREAQLSGRRSMEMPPAPGIGAVRRGRRACRSRWDARPSGPAQSGMFFAFQFMDLSEQYLFMIETNAMRGHFHVKEADFADQRLSSLVFTPGADNFHTNLLEQT